jgi:hypothetical protein
LILQQEPLHELSGAIDEESIKGFLQEKQEGLLLITPSGYKEM